MSSLPIRVRVTLAFAGVMAVVLAALGLFLYLRLEAELDGTIDAALQTRTAELAPLARGGDPVPPGDAENFARVLGPGQSLPRFVDPVRTVSTPLGDGRALVVGTAIDDRDDALRTLAILLLIGGPITLALASAAGYGAATAALRPVERMRRRAAAMTDPSARLPVGPADDEIGRLGTTLNAMLGRLEEASARERAFVADASHELRTPLAILKAELELALHEGRTVAELEAALRSAGDETDRLIRLANDLLVLARTRDGRMPISRAPHDVRWLLESAATASRARAEAHLITLDVDVPDASAFLDAMRVR